MAEFLELSTILKSLSKIMCIMILGSVLASQDICDDFNVSSLEFSPDTEWGNLLLFYVDVPDTSIYAPYFFLLTDDEFIHVTDSIASYFWVTGPTTVDLLYHFDYDSIPPNHPFSGQIQMVSGDGLLTCNLPFEFIVNQQILLGDVNLDGEINLLDIILMIYAEIHQILLSPEQHSAADMDLDGDIDVVDVIMIVNIILEDV